MIGWLHDMFLTNWRNKGVALFFAVSIWFVAYQSESRDAEVPIKVRFLEEKPDVSVITQLYVKTTADGDGEETLTPFNGEIMVTYTGPRKLVERIKDGPVEQKTIRVPVGVDKYNFAKDLVRREGVFTTLIDPEDVWIDQENVVEVTRNLNEKKRIIVSHYGGNYQLTKEIRDPKAQSVRLRVPASRQDAEVQILISMEDRSRIEGSFALSVLPADDAMLQKSARIWHFEREVWVGVGEAPLIPVLVRREVTQDTFSRNVKLTFRVPVMPTGIQIITHDLSGDTIPVKFSGPWDRIQLLKKRLEEDPGFALSVPLPSNLDLEKGGTFNFTEDSLEILDFPGVRVERHEDRVKEGKTGWYYEVKVLNANEAKEE